MSHPLQTDVSTVTKTATQDPALPAFWDQRFNAGITPWDQGGVQREFVRFVNALPSQARVLVPGCGAGYEAKHLAERGFPVVAIDYAEAAIAAAKPVLGAHEAVLKQADFFDRQASVMVQPFQVIFERAFLCALPPRLWAQWAVRCAELVVEQGVLAGYFMVAPQTAERGPPFGIAFRELNALLHPHFELFNDQSVSDPLSVFKGQLRWMQWRRNAVVI